MNEEPPAVEHYTWDEMEKEPLNEKASRQYVNGKKAMLARIFFKKGALVPTHQHDSEQITYILEGALLFRLEGKEVTVGKGQVLLIPSNVPHSAEALEDTVDLDVFSPIRQDWIDKDDAYLRR